MRSRDFLLRSGPNYVGVLVILLHLPFVAFVGGHWLDLVLPSLMLTSLYFLVPFVVARLGTLSGAASFISLSVVQVSLLSASLGTSSGLHYYFFSISTVAVYIFYGLPRLWAFAFAALPMLCFAAVETLIGNNGWITTVPPPLSSWFAATNALGSFTIAATIGFLFSRAMREAESLLIAEQHRSEGLLLNILPEPIANRLKSGKERVIADRVDDVSVLFADLVGFTPYSREREPTAVVGMLNELFSRFDDKVAALGLEKIKTVGDAYMVVAGAPNPHPDHLALLAKLALAIVEEVGAFVDDGGRNFAIRIGLHVGPAVMGVIGRHKMAYDAWGDTVNVASRLESSSLPNRIHVSPEVVRRLDGRFVFEARGETDIKGVGAMKTFFLATSL
jgi:adenylate cyclase